MKKKCVFLDRDGVINRPIFRDGRSFAPRCLNDFYIYPLVKKSCELLKRAGFIIVVVTNQPDVGENITDISIMDEMHELMVKNLPIDSVYACLHRKDEDCLCRKPKPGLIFDALQDYDIDLDLSYLVGDRWSDIELARVVKCKSIFIDLGYDELKPNSQFATVKDLYEATKFILFDIC